MSLPKLINICQVLDAKQCISLKKFVLLFIGKETDLYDVLDRIIQEKDKLKKPEDVDKMVSKHYKHITKKTFMNYLSQLFQYTESWMAYEQMQENEFQKDLLVQQWLNKRGLYQLSDLVVNRVRKEIDGDTRLDINRARVKADLLFEHFFSNNPVKYDLDFILYEEMFLAHQEYTKGQILIMISEWISWCMNARKEYPVNLVKAKEEMMVHHDTHVLNLLVDLIGLVENNDFHCMKRLMDSLLGDQFVDSTRLHFIVTSYLANRVFSLRTAGMLKDVELIYPIVHYAVGKSIFFSQGKIPVTTFHGLIFKIVIYKTYDEMIIFIDENIFNVVTENIESTKALALAQICLYTDRYHEILTNLRNWEFDNVTQKTIAIGLRLIGAFMGRKKEGEMFKNVLHNTTSYFKRNDTIHSKLFISGYKNLIDFVKKLDRGEDLDLLDINTYDYLIYRKWCEFALLEVKKGKL